MTSILRQATKEDLPQGTRSCIFCAGRPLTREHVWPKWLSAELQQHGFTLDRPDGAPHQVRLVGITADRQHAHQEVETVGGAKLLGDLVARSVCGPCNNGWMSALEDSAKPSLLALIRGTDATFEQEALVSLATWAVKTAILYQSQDPASLAWTAEQLQRFRVAGRPPALTTVSLARWTDKTQQGPHSMGGAYGGVGRPNRFGVTVLLVGYVAITVRAATDTRYFGQLATLGKEWSTIWTPVPSQLTWRAHRRPALLQDVERLTSGFAAPDGP
ncbi:hypothetical protein ACFWGN_18005 [Oerskovia sp. NPDC060338]|uniref:hypothetical protein n=1 Tax=Oerskovia sp. NPDC060338 TaxID=3347100 RepID=UPI003667356C